MATATTPTATSATSLTPALPPPSGTTSNFENPDNLKQSMNIAMGVAIPLVTIFFGLRTYVRVWIKRQWIAEDWLALIAFIGTISFCATGAVTMNHHGGEHEWDITPAQAKEASYWFNVASIHYGITICIAKLAILFLYRRVFSVHPRSGFDLTCLFLIVLLILFYVATNITKIWECVPRAKIWDSSIPGHCIDTPTLLNVSGIFNTVTDFIIILLPVRAVWDMRMSFKKKAAVVLAFTFGLCAPAFSLAGTLVRFQGSTNPDKTWVQPDIIMWGLAELTTGVLCVSFPEMGVLRKRKAWSRRKSGVASTSIREGRYRRQDAVYQGPSRPEGFTISISRGTTLGGTTIMGSTKGGGEVATQYELDEVNLIEEGHLQPPDVERPYFVQGKADSTESVEKEDGGVQASGLPVGSVGVTREFRMESRRLSDR